MNLIGESRVTRKTRVVQVPSRKELPLLIVGQSFSSQWLRWQRKVELGKRICPWLWKLGTALVSDTVLNMVTKILNQEAEWWAQAWEQGMPA